MFAALLFAAAVEITGPDIELCTKTVQALFAAMDERAKAYEESTRPATRMNRTFSEPRGGGARVERYNRQIRDLREQLDQQQCSVRFVQDEATEATPE